MGKLLYIEASPRKERSASIAVARRFLDSYKESHSGDRIETWDLWSSELPSFDGDVLDAKYAILHGQSHTPDQQAAWGAVVNTFERFNSADKYLFSLPMWNFGIPYRLKHFIDVITQPGLAFSFSPEEGYQGLVTERPATVVYARGGEYSSSEESMALDFQKPYFETLLGFIGITEVQSIVVEPTLGGGEVGEKAAEAASARAQELGKKF